MGLSSSKSKTTSQQTATVAPNATYAPQIDDAAAQFKPAYQAAAANNASLMPRVTGVLDYYQHQIDQPLGTNPYLEGIISRSNADISNGVNSRFEGAGRYGSGMSSQVLGRALADNENQLRYGDYTAQQARQDVAARGVLGATGVSAALPQAASGAYADAVRGLVGQYTTGNQTGSGTSTSSPSILGMLIQGAQNAAKAYGGG